MKIIFRSVLGLAAGAVLLGGVCNTAYGLVMNVDTVLADDPAITTADASVDMTVSGSTLTIVLRNLYSGGSGGANGLLTGLAFDLPDNYEIVSGSVVVGTSSYIRGGSLNGSGAGTSVSGEWGYENGTTGHFNGLATDTQVSAMEADTTPKFSNTRIDPPTVLDGPEFGLLGLGGNRGGLTAIEDSIIITLQLNRTPNGGFLNGIQGGIVAVTYGSPGGQGVPDGGMTVALLGMGVCSLLVVSRKLKHS